MQYLTMSGFGRWGRWANQLFQYAFLHLYAQEYGATLQIPHWAGEYVFGLQSSPITRRLPPYVENGGKHHERALPPEGDELLDHDFRGYAQFHTSYYAPHRGQIQGMFQPTGEVLERVEPITWGLEDYFTIGIHLRRGDFGQKIHPIIPTSWYLRWLERHWSRFSDWNPALFIATETPELVQEFAAYDPQTPETLGVSLRAEPMPSFVYLKKDAREKTAVGLDFYPDFFGLTQCDVIVAPSSTFSFMAGMINPNLKEFWRASLEAEDFVDLDVWNDWPILYEHVEDYPHLEGIRLKRSDYW